VLAYATNRELKDKLDRPLTPLADLPEPPRQARWPSRSSVRGGGADEAVNALPDPAIRSVFFVQLRIAADRFLL
jgi:hypothetical protein